MPFPIVIIAALFGTIVGSFLNVVALRLHVRTFLTGRSACPACATTLPARDLIPILSFMFLGGRCRFCQTPISPRYLLVEVLCGAMFAMLALTISEPVLLLLFMLAFSILFLIALYDMEHLIIPDSLVYFFVALALVVSLAFREPYELLAGPFLFLPFFLLALLSGGRALGWGDVKLSVGLGWLVGLEGALLTFLFSIWVGGIVGVVLLGMRRFGFQSQGEAVTMKSEVPFAPFLIFGAFGAMVSGVSLADLLQFFTL